MQMKERVSFKLISLLSLVVFFLWSSNTPLYALPGDYEVVSGEVTVSQIDHSTVQINASDGAIINFSSFNINTGESVYFVQPNAGASVLNRVTGGSASFINGGLFGPGQIFLVNAAGIHFGAQANVNVGSLIASTLDIANEDFLAGNYHFQNATGITPGEIINQGHLSTNHEGGLIALMSPSVRNEGQVVAQLGTVALVSGNAVTLNLSPDGLISIAIDEALEAVVTDENGETKTPIQNIGDIIADGGVVLIQAKTAQGLVDRVINQEGNVQARSLVEREGRIFLDGGESGVVSNTGILDASSAEDGADAGSINVVGKSIFNNGSILAKGANNADGGSISVVAQQDLILGETSVVDASGGGVNSNGGNIYLYSYGTVNAASGQVINISGGQTSGDGGSGELSAVIEVMLDGSIVADVQAGYEPAEFLVDPVGNLVIFSPSLGAANTTFWATRHIFILGNVSSTSGNVRFFANHLLPIPFLWDGVFDPNVGSVNVSGSVTTGTGNVFMLGMDINLAGTIQTNGGDVYLGAQRDINHLDDAADINTNGGAFIGYADIDTNDTGSYTMGADNSIVTDGGAIVIASGNTPWTANNGGDLVVAELNAGSGGVFLWSGNGSITSAAGFGGVNATSDFWLIAAAGNSISLTTAINGNVALGVFGASGDITINNTGDIVFPELTGFDTVSAPGNIQITNDGSVTFDSNSEIISSGSNVVLDATGDVNLGLIQAAGIAAVRSSSGAIVDANGVDDNLIAAGVILSAANGVGTGTAIETQTGALAASNSTSNNIEISNTGDVVLTDLNVSGIGTVNGVTNSAAGGIVTIQAASDIVVLVPLSTAGGLINLIASDNVLIAATVMSSGGDIAFSAGDTTAVGAEVTSDGGNITMTAANDVIVGANIATDGGDYFVAAGAGDIIYTSGVDVTTNGGSYLAIANNNVIIGASSDTDTRALVGVGGNIQIFATNGSVVFDDDANSYSGGGTFAVSAFVDVVFVNSSDVATGGGDFTAIAGTGSIIHGTGALGSDVDTDGGAYTATAQLNIIHGVNSDVETDGGNVTETANTGSIAYGNNANVTTGGGNYTATAQGSIFHGDNSVLNASGSGGDVLEQAITGSIIRGMESDIITNGGNYTAIANANILFGIQADTDTRDTTPGLGGNVSLTASTGFIVFQDDANTYTGGGNYTALAASDIVYVDSSDVSTHGGDFTETSTGGNIIHGTGILGADVDTDGGTYLATAQGHIVHDHLSDVETDSGTVTEVANTGTILYGDDANVTTSGGAINWFANDNIIFVSNNDINTDALVGLGGDIFVSTAVGSYGFGDNGTITTGGGNYAVSTALDIIYGNNVSVNTSGSGGDILDAAAGSITYGDNYTATTNGGNVTVIAGTGIAYGNSAAINTDDGLGTGGNYAASASTDSFSAGDAFTVTTGGGSQTILANLNVIFGNNALLSTGAGDQTIQAITDSLVAGNNFTANSAGGMQSVFSFSGTTVGDNASLLSGSGDQTIIVQNGNLVANNNFLANSDGGVQSVSIFDSAILVNDASFLSNGGTQTFQTLTGSVNANNNFTANSGGGDQTFNMFDSVVFNNDASFLSQGGNQSITTSTGSFGANNNFTANSDGGLQTFNSFDFIFFVDNASFLSNGGAQTITSSTGSFFANDNLTVNSDGGAQTFSIFDSIIVSDNASFLSNGGGQAISVLTGSLIGNDNFTVSSNGGGQSVSIFDSVFLNDNASFLSNGGGQTLTTNTGSLFANDNFTVNSGGGGQAVSIFDTLSINDNAGFLSDGGGQSVTTSTGSFFAGENLVANSAGGAQSFDIFNTIDLGDSASFLSDGGNQSIVTSTGSIFAFDNFLANSGGGAQMVTSGNDLFMGVNTSFITDGADTTITAANSISFGDGSSIDSSIAGNITLEATAGSFTSGNSFSVTTQGGNYAVTAGTDIFYGTDVVIDMTGSGGDITDVAGGNLTYGNNFSLITNGGNYTAVAGADLIYGNTGTVTTVDSFLLDNGGVIVQVAGNNLFLGVGSNFLTDGGAYVGVAGNDFSMLVNAVTESYPTISTGTGSVTIVAGNDATITGIVTDATVAPLTDGIVTIGADGEIIDAADFYASVPPFADPTSVADYFDIWTGSNATQFTNIFLGSGAFPLPNTFPFGGLITPLFEGATWPGIGTSGANGALELFLTPPPGGLLAFNTELARDPSYSNPAAGDKNCVDMTVVDGVGGASDFAAIAEALSIAEGAPVFSQPCTSSETLPVVEGIA